MMTEYDDLEEILQRFQPVGPPATMKVPAVLAPTPAPPSSRSAHRLIVGGGAALAVAVIGVLLMNRPVPRLTSELAPSGDRAASPPGRNTPVRVGGDIPPVARTRTVTPFYPTDPRPGMVAILELTVEPSGRVNDVKVVRTAQDGEITAAAVDAAGQWEFEPLELGGEPVWFIQVVVIYHPMR